MFLFLSSTEGERLKGHCNLHPVLLWLRKPSLYLNIHVYFGWVISVEKIIQMYSSIPSGEKEKIDISVCFLFSLCCVDTAANQKGEEEKTHVASEGVSVMKKMIRQK